MSGLPAAIGRRVPQSVFERQTSRRGPGLSHLQLADKCGNHRPNDVFSPVRAICLNRVGASPDRDGVGEEDTRGAKG